MLMTLLALRHWRMLGHIICRCLRRAWRSRWYHARGEHGHSVGKCWELESKIGNDRRDTDGAVVRVGILTILASVRLTESRSICIVVDPVRIESWPVTRGTWALIAPLVGGHATRDS